MRVLELNFIFAVLVLPVLIVYGRYILTETKVKLSFIHFRTGLLVYCYILLSGILLLVLEEKLAANYVLSAQYGGDGFMAPGLSLNFKTVGSVLFFHLVFLVFLFLPNDKVRSENSSDSEIQFLVFSPLAGALSLMGGLFSVVLFSEMTMLILFVRDIIDQKLSEEEAAKLLARRLTFWFVLLLAGISSILFFPSVDSKIVLILIYISTLLIPAFDTKSTQNLTGFLFRTWFAIIFVNRTDVSLIIRSSEKSGMYALLAVASLISLLVLHRKEKIMKTNWQILCLAYMGFMALILSSEASFNISSILLALIFLIIGYLALLTRINFERLLAISFPLFNLFIVAFVILCAPPHYFEAIDLSLVLTLVFLGVLFFGNGKDLSEFKSTSWKIPYSTLAYCYAGLCIGGVFFLLSLFLPAFDDLGGGIGGALSVVFSMAFVFTLLGYFFGKKKLIKVDLFNLINDALEATIYNLPALLKSIDSKVKVATASAVNLLRTTSNDLNLINKRATSGLEGFILTESEMTLRSLANFVRLGHTGKVVHFWIYGAIVWILMGILFGLL